MTDLIVRNGKILAGADFVVADIAVDGGVITEIAPAISGRAAREIDASDLLVLPGVFDAHIHFNEPGREHWEGFATGSRALAAGGGTSFVDMPLNAAPPTIDRASFEAKRGAGEARSVLDFALWGGLIPGNLDHLEELAACGVVGFKAFMIDSGTADFPGVDAKALATGMKIAAKLNRPVAVHAEDKEMIAQRTAAEKAAGRTGVRGFLESRPPESEIEAARIAMELAGEAGCELHIVHVSCPEVVELIQQARACGLRVTGEVCAHHLLLNEDAMFEHGAFAKCAPPLRDEARRERLWRDFREGRVHSIGSDHSPAPPDMKTGDDLFAAWGGIMGCQHGFLLLLDRLSDLGDAALAAGWNLMSASPASQFGFGGRKGRIALGCDADLVFIERTGPRSITSDELLYRHRTSPYAGLEIRSRVAQSLLRGQDIGLPGAGGRFLSRT